MLKSVLSSVSLFALLTGVFPVTATSAETGRPTGGQPDPSRPKNYDAFVKVTDDASLKAAMATADCLYFPSTAKPGRDVTTFEIDNPLIIDRDRPLVMHGNYRQVTLVRKNKNEPMFIVRRVPYFNLERMQLDCEAYPEITNAVAIRFENKEPVRAEFQQVDFKEGSLIIAGPGRYVLQRVGNRMHGLLHAGILIDHPEAEVSIVSGGGGNKSEPAILKSEDIYWIWCKRGHVETYGCFPAGFTRGRADIRIDSPSPRGAHIIAYSRTEGTKLRRGPTGGAVGQLLYVPPSDLPVNVALKANHFACNESNSAMVGYNAAGTLWLIGNNATPSAELLKSTTSIEERQIWLVRGNAPKATVVAIGNTACSPDALSQIDAGTKIAQANYAPLRTWYQNTPLLDSSPFNRFLDEVGGTAPIFPEVPRSNPRLLDCIPVGDAPPPALDLVSVKSFGATGDGATDDTAALQAAFDSDKVTRLFFPPGVYLISKPLDLKIQERFGGGGWIAGAGADRTRIKNGNGGTVIDANGVYWTVIQGLAFETTDQRDICFSLDKVTGHTSGVNFYDCHFIGGSVAMGIAMKSGPNCEHIFHNRCVFENAGIGYAMGNVNALQNLVCQSTFRNNRINMALRWRSEDGTLTAEKAWGCFGILGATFQGTKEKDFDFGLHKRRYFLGIVSDSPMICDGREASKFGDTQLFESCEWSQAAETFYGNGATGGPIFLNSKVNSSGIAIAPGGQGLGFAVNLGSDMGGVPWPRPAVEFREPTMTEKQAERKKAPK